MLNPDEALVCTGAKPAQRISKICVVVILLDFFQFVRVIEMCYKPVLPFLRIFELIELTSCVA